MNCTVACFCGNVYTAPPNRCDECGCTFGEFAPSRTASATDGAHAAAAGTATLRRTYRGVATRTGESL
jgi:hypothetical protein